MRLPTSSFFFPLERQSSAGVSFFDNRSSFFSAILVKGVSYPPTPPPRPCLRSFASPCPCPQEKSTLSSPLHFSFLTHTRPPDLLLSKLLVSAGLLRPDSLTWCYCCCCAVLLLLLLLIFCILLISRTRTPPSRRCGFPCAALTAPSSSSSVPCTASRGSQPPCISCCRQS